MSRRNWEEAKEEAWDSIWDVLVWTGCITREEANEIPSEGGPLTKVEKIKHAIEHWNHMDRCGIAHELGEILRES